MTTTSWHTGFLSNIPFSLFKRDARQGSLHDLKEESKTFFWHQFMLDVLHHIPRSSADIDNVIAACHLVNEYDSGDSILLNEDDIAKFRMEYEAETAINWYTRNSFFYRAFNKACRMLDSDAIVLFHPIVKDLDAQLKQDYKQQISDGTLTLPLTVFRGQKEIGAGELKKIQENIGGLISMHTFLSTSFSCDVASNYISGADRTTAVIFQITVNKEEEGKGLDTFADISQKSVFTHEGEVLFGVSSVFRIISAGQDDFHWFIELELTSCKEDESVQTFISEVQTYLYQNSDKRVPLIILKQLLTIDSLSYARPLVELIRFFFVEIAQLFVVQTYKNKGRMKKLIENLPDLHALVTTTYTNVISPNSTIICLLFDMLDHFLYPMDNKNQEEVSFNNNDSRSLLCFGGFLLLTGDLWKGTRYFQMLLKNESIDDSLKCNIHGLLGASYAMTKDQELATKSISMATEMLQSSGAQSMPGWFPSFLASSCMTMEHSDQQTNDIVKMLEPFTNKEQSNNTVDEKLRLLHLGHICFEQGNFVDALNHWEEAAEIESHMPFSAEIIYNGVVYIQMAAAYFRLNNKFNALHTMEKAMKCLECYYPSTHRMFATLNFVYGFYLMQNDQPSEAMESLKKSLENPHFSANQEFCAHITFLLASASVQSGDLDSAELYCYKARTYNSSDINAQASVLLEAIPQLRGLVRQKGLDFIRRLAGAGLAFGQQLASLIHSHSTTSPKLNDEETCTSQQLITIADQYRHRQDKERAEVYYSKALEKMIESESKSMWNVYRKMVRMDNHNDRYREYFIEQYSKYDDNNPNHLSMIATLQTILYKFSLSENEYKVAFDCLISSGLVAAKSLFYQINTNSDCLSGLLDYFFHYESIAKMADILTKLMEIYSTVWAVYLQQFLSGYMIIDDLAAIIHHATLDCILSQMISKYDNDPPAEKICRFLTILLKFLRQSITETDTLPSTLSFKDQVLKFLNNYNDEESSWFYFIKILESLCTGDKDGFATNIDRFRSQTVTFERYQELKQTVFFLFARLDENQLYSYLESLAKIQ